MPSNIEVDLIVEAIAKGFDKVAADVGDLGDQGERAAEGMEKAGKSSGALDVALGNLASGALTKIGEAMLDFAKGSLEVASSAQETASLIDNSLGPAADGFRDSMEQIAAATGRSTVELEAGASTIIAMSRSMGMGQEAAAGFSATMAQIALDLGSFFDKDTSQVFEDLQSAMAGSAETMLKYGIDVKETALQNAALEMGLIGVGEKLDRVTRAQVLQAEVMRQAADAMGDAARTSDSYENTQKSLQSALTDLQMVIGEALLPAMTQLAQEAIPAVVAATESLAPAIEQAGGAFANQITLMASTAQWNQLKNQLESAGVSTEEFNSILSDSKQTIDLWRTSADKMRDIESNQRGIQRMAIAIEALNAGLEAGSEEFLAFVLAKDRDIDKAEALNDAYADLSDGSFVLADAITSSKDAVEDQADSFDRTAERLDFLALAAQDAGQAVDDFEVSASDIAINDEQVAAAAESMIAFRAEVDAAKNAILGITSASEVSKRATVELWVEGRAKAQEYAGEVAAVNAMLDGIEDSYKTEVELEAEQALADAEALNAELDKLTGVAEETKTPLEELNEELDGLAQTYETELENNSTEAIEEAGNVKTSYEDIPPEIVTEFETPGADDAIGKVQALLDSLNALPASLTINVNTTTDGGGGDGDGGGDGGDAGSTPGGGGRRSQTTGRQSVTFVQNISQVDPFSNGGAAGAAAGRRAVESFSNGMRG